MLHVLAGAFMISFSGVWVTIAEVPAITSAFYRMFFGFLFLLAAMLLRREMKPVSVKVILRISLCGFVFALDLFFWHNSILSIGPGLATILGNFQVFLLATYGIFFLDEKIRPRFLLALPLAIAGLLMVVGFDWSQLGTQYKQGILHGLLTAACYAVFLLLLRTLQGRNRAHSLFTTLMLVSLTCALLLGGKMAIMGESFAIHDMRSLAALLGLGFFSQAVGWILIANAMPKIRASFTGLILLLQPSLAFLWDVLLFDRPTAAIHWFGICLTLSAIYMGLTGSTRKP